MISALKRCAAVALLSVSAVATHASTPQPDTAASVPAIGAAHSVTVCIWLTGLQEIPPAKTNALGKGTITIADVGGAVTGKITASRMHSTGAYIEQGEEGTNGRRIVTLKTSGRGTWTVPDNTTLTSEQYQSLQAGDLYVNVISDAHRTGEIRGQIGSTYCGTGGVKLTPIAPAR